MACPPLVRAWLLCIQTVALVWSTCAQDDPPAAGVDLAEAQRLAVERNWDLLAARSEVDAAVAQGWIAHEFPNPSLSISTTQISVDGGHPNQGGFFGGRDYDTIVAVNQLFEIGGKRRSRQEAARAGLDGARARFEDATRTLEMAVTSAYAAAAESAENVKVLRASAASLRREAQIAAVRSKAGDLSTADRERIEISARELELDAQSAETAVTTALVNLELLLGVPRASGKLVLKDRLETLASQPNEGMSGVVAAAGRADLVAAEQELKQAEANLRLQRAGRIPDPTVSLQYEHQPPDLPNTIGLGISLPLPFWNHNRGAIHAAEAARDEARVNIQKVRAQVEADVVNARATYASAQRRWENYRDQLRPDSARIRDTVAFAYEKGGASLLDLLSAERDDNQVRLAAIQAAGDNVIAAAALRAATRRINLDSLNHE